MTILIAMNKYRIYHVYEEYKRRYTPLDGLPEAIAEGKQPSGVYRVYTPRRRDISGLYNIWTNQWSGYIETQR